MQGENGRLDIHECVSRMIQIDDLTGNLNCGAVYALRQRPNGCKHSSTGTRVRARGTNTVRCSCSSRKVLGQEDRRQARTDMGAPNASRKAHCLLSSRPNALPTKLQEPARALAEASPPVAPVAAPNMDIEIGIRAAPSQDPLPKKRVPRGKVWHLPRLHSSA
jgi:hypothetical protein